MKLTLPEGLKVSKLILGISAPLYNKRFPEAPKQLLWGCNEVTSPAGHLQWLPPASLPASASLAHSNNEESSESAQRSAWAAALSDLPHKAGMLQRQDWSLEMKTAAGLMLCHILGRWLFWGALKISYKRARQDVISSGEKVSEGLALLWKCVVLTDAGLIDGWKYSFFIIYFLPKTWLKGRNIC